MKNKLFLFILMLLYPFAIAQVELGIDSIEKLGSEDSIKNCTYCEEITQYEIIFYIENPNDDVAGFQFSLLPEGLFEFNKDNISKGESENAGFTIYAGKGTVLGFSMTGNVILANKDRQMLFKLRTSLKDLAQFGEYEINLENLVLASKKGETLKSEFVPYQISKIK